MKLDEQPGVPQLSPSVGLLGPVLPAFKAFADERCHTHIFAKTRAVFPAMAATDAQRFEQPYIFFAGYATRPRRPDNMDVG